MNEKLSTMPDIVLEQFILGELPRKEMNEIEKMRMQDMDLDARIEKIRKSNDEILDLYKPEAVGIAIKKRLKEAIESDERMTKSSNKAFAKLIPVMTFGIVFTIGLIVFFPLITGKDGRISNETILLKGDISLSVYRQTQSGNELLLSGSEAHPGDRFQIKYGTSDFKYGIIFSIDGNGNTTLHLPETINDKAQIEIKGENTLPEAFELDSAPGFERFFLVVSKTRFPVREILDAANRLATDPRKAKDDSLGISDKFVQKSFILIKKEIQK
jgi:hypothetical protein